MAVLMMVQHWNIQ